MAGSWLVPTTEAVKDVVGADAFSVYPPDGAHRAVSEPLRTPFPSRSRKYHEPSDEKTSEVDRFLLIAVKRVFCNWPSISLATVISLRDREALVIVGTTIAIIADATKTVTKTSVKLNPRCPVMVASQAR
jgi:hypothetical protein